MSNITACIISKWSEKDFEGIKARIVDVINRFDCIGKDLEIPNSTPGNMVIAEITATTEVLDLIAQDPEHGPLSIIWRSDSLPATGPVGFRVALRAYLQSQGWSDAEVKGATRGISRGEVGTSLAKFLRENPRVHNNK